MVAMPSLLDARPVLNETLFFDLDDTRRGLAGRRLQERPAVLIGGLSDPCVDADLNATRHRLEDPDQLRLHRCSTGTARHNRALNATG